MPDEEPPAAPPLSWRIGSKATMAFIGLLCKGFLKVATKETSVEGLDEFIKLLDERKDVQGRTRGLLTVSNHTSVVDDPLIWAFLPLRFVFSPDNLRWSLGSYDICFQGNSKRTLTSFFNRGQVLPTHRILYSPHGGLFQPTITQCIRLLSRGPFAQPTPYTAPTTENPRATHQEASSFPQGDPFTDPTHPYTTYTTTGTDTFPVPTSFASRRHAWVHIFPEGKVHQHPDRDMRYFKWGVARLILESEPCPDVVPVWIEGPEEVFHEERPAPRWWPRWRKKIHVTFGERVDGAVWEEFRGRWRGLCEKDKEERERKRAQDGGEVEEEYVGVLSDGLKYGEEAVKLRMEVTMRVREEVSKLRRRRGLKDEDPKAHMVETWRLEGPKQEGRMEDGSWVKDM